ncbi:methylated-DNA--[protein]-cysteine S-methyltransferase [Myceligenerans pegani]|uniref:Methylated-DNA--[protein]-cysteine S-methyltransferase n=1 Tax=Myceligenerans pegani TaxID=2776917 RepID=A0ABR9MU83_9MICO|nr:methylated-DNA--[protein]-cysteine S-methyltransferase [Myceligenerans sp. TRM 65318]MBE1874448.1 methylated-DNA--[protein]-cysteine S-methyltransferase [Myceligenerans sp. TRM 65318]MBE3016719.1 methylated-DNA--[protein]-cysteine S-methyltransferase [Myceligenerans sp. TRM 65318]
MHATTLDTPDGPFTIIGSEAPTGPDQPDAAVLASGWTDDAESLVALIHRSLRTDPVSGHPPRTAGLTRDHGPAPAADAQPPSAGILTTATEAVLAYYDGDHGAPARVPVRQASGEYRTHAWDVLRDVAPGERLTYTEYAARTGRPAAVRAAAGACAMNAAALFVPCHRVLRTDGTLGGFRYGLEIKQSLLARES